MATVATEAVGDRDRRLFLQLAIAMTVTIVLGFSTQLAMGRSTFASPWPIHLHAFVFFGWTALFLSQVVLAGRSIALHRTMGWIGVFWAVAVVVIGIVTTAAMVRRGTTPFFFQPAYFLFMNSLSALCFGGLFAAAIRMRGRTDWHRRLMICAMAALTGPAFGRLLPMPLLIPWAGWAVFAAILIIPLYGMVADRRARGRLHPAWVWGVGALTVTQLAMSVSAWSAPGLALYHAVTAGQPGAEVEPLGFPAPYAGPLTGRP